MNDNARQYAPNQFTTKGLQPVAEGGNRRGEIEEQLVLLQNELETLEKQHSVIDSKEF